jgi:hypothetical protein
MKISLWVFRIRGFDGGIGVPKRGGSLNSTEARLLNHQTSKISINLIWMKISLWVFKIRGFEGGIGVPKRGGPLNSTWAGLLIHQTSKFSLFCLMNQNLWMRVLDLRFRRGNWAANVWGTSELPGTLISNHKVSIFSLFAIESKFVGGCLQFEDLKEELGPQHFRDSKISPGP